MGGIYSTSAGSFPQSSVSQRQKSSLYQRWITVHQRGCSIKQLLKLIILVADSESGRQISEAKDRRKPAVQCSSRLQWGPGGECSCVAPPSKNKHNKKLLVFTPDLLFQAVHQTKVAQVQKLIPTGFHLISLTWFC